MGPMLFVLLLVPVVTLVATALLRLRKLARSLLGFAKELEP